MNNGLGNKQIMAKNIQKYMNLFDKDRKEICKDLNISYTTFTDWVNGNTYPRIDKIEMLAKYFGVSKADLVEDDYNSTSSGVVRIPVYGSVSAGDGVFAEGNIENYVDIPEEMARHGDFFGLKISGDSMEPDIKDGDIVIVKRQEHLPANGKTVIAIVNGDEGFCKRLAKYADGLGLVSNNPAYTPKYFSADEVRDLPVRIVGVVERLIREF